jgi:septal ring factor EnvC (AmiA/AmiB activator)
MEARRLMLRRLLSRLGYEPKRPAAEPERIQLLKRWAEQLNEKATRFRTVAERSVLLEQRIDQLDGDLMRWEKRAVARLATRDPELAADVARICGRIEGQLQESRAELANLHADENHLRTLLTDQRRSFAEQLELCRGLGDDVNGCLLYIDLTRPDRVADLDLLADDELDFVARVIDADGIH